MYPNNYIIPYNSNYMYRSAKPNQNDDRFLFPFLIGGVAGTALGYGIASNNNPTYYPYPPYYYPNYYLPRMQPYPVYYPGRK